MKEWQLQTAKAQLSDLVKQAQCKGPQAISVRGAVAVIVISQEEYQALSAPKVTLVTFMQKSPLMGLELNLSRNQSKTRDTDL